MLFTILRKREMQGTLFEAVKNSLCKEAQFYLDDVNDETIDLAREAQEKHLPTIGRIGEGQVGSVIDGAKLDGYMEHGAVTIRMDHSTSPQFWVETIIDLRKLQVWLLKNHNVTMTFCQNK